MRKSFAGIADRAADRRWSQLMTMDLTPAEARTIGKAVADAAAKRRDRAKFADVDTVYRNVWSLWSFPRRAA